VGAFGRALNAEAATEADDARDDRGEGEGDPNLKIRVSERVVGDWGRRLNDEFHEKEVLLPRSEKLHPTPGYIQWHNEQIFKGVVG
jgi:putative restriction endonuclease